MVDVLTAAVDVSTKLPEVMATRALLSEIKEDTCQRQRSDEDEYENMQESAISAIVAPAASIAEPTKEEPAEEVQAIVSGPSL